MPDVPLLMDYATTQEQKQMLATFAARQAMGRPFFAPAGVPAPVVTMLRRAFDATLRDPEFLAEAQKTGLEINPVSGARVQELVEEIYRTPPEVIKKMVGLSE